VHSDIITSLKYPQIFKIWSDPKEEIMGGERYTFLRSKLHPAVFHEPNALRHMDRHIQCFGRYIHALYEAIFSFRRSNLIFDKCMEGRKSHKHSHSHRAFSIYWILRVVELMKEKREKRRGREDLYIL
jgi:hypothetical protein